MLYDLLYFLFICYSKWSNGADSLLSCLHWTLTLFPKNKTCQKSCRCEPVSSASAQLVCTSTFWFWFRCRWTQRTMIKSTQTTSDHRVISETNTATCRTRIERLPPDLIWLEWCSGRGPRTITNRRRPMAAYKYNLLEHIGTVSSFSVRVDRPSFPKCYESMADVWSLAKNERFQVCHAVMDDSWQ